ncbi:hypothetical protein [Microvirga subterranea]|uniref:Uncharacterized protein n=1 Tax=Microvirga subterranea TaxID=186651 RepID=A0A370H4U5_9HYPH|nr:hypothetical protein [Microvirga subterranea]RDI51264.1 hypothetical protein DES45_11948 [Microvirga subterranea]
MPLRLLLRSAALAVAFSLASCGYVPRPVAGLPPGEPWGALPLRKWLAEDRAEPLALSFCAPPECRPGLAAGVIRLTGKDAEITRALLKDPERLARALRSPAGRDKPVRAQVSVERLKGGPYDGFAITLAPADGGKRPAYGAALGRPEGDGLTVVLVIGEDPENVRATVRDVAERELGS